MKSILKPFLLILTLAFTFAGSAFAQKQYETGFYISAHSSKRDIKINGKLIAINDTALVLVDKKGKSHFIAFSKLSFIRVDKNRSDLGIGIITGALVAGNITLAASTEDALTAFVIGLGGTIGIVAIMGVVHTIVHPPLLKLKSTENPFTRELMVQRLTPYFATETPAKP